VRSSFAGGDRLPIARGYVGQGPGAPAEAKAGRDPRAIAHLVLARSRALVRPASMGTREETASRSRRSLSLRCERLSAGPRRARWGRSPVVSLEGWPAPAYAGECGSSSASGTRSRTSSSVGVSSSPPETLASRRKEQPARGLRAGPPAYSLVGTSGIGSSQVRTPIRSSSARDLRCARLRRGPESGRAPRSARPVNRSPSGALQVAGARKDRHPGPWMAPFTTRRSGFGGDAR
jgi:hypothetical protein